MNDDPPTRRTVAYALGMLAFAMLALAVISWSQGDVETAVTVIVVGVVVGAYWVWDWRRGPQS